MFTQKLNLQDACNIVFYPCDLQITISYGETSGSYNVLICCGPTRDFITLFQTSLNTAYFEEALAKVQAYLRELSKIILEDLSSPQSSLQEILRGSNPQINQSSVMSLDFIDVIIDTLQREGIAKTFLL